VGCERISAKVVNIGCVEHLVSGGWKQGLVSTISWAVLTETLQAIDDPTKV
jgi:hypothetical protein